MSDERKARERVLLAKGYILALLAQGRTLDKALAAASVSWEDWAKHGK